MKQYTRQVLGRSQTKVLDAVRAAGPGGLDRDGVIAATEIRSGNPSLQYALDTLRKRGLILQGSDYRYRAAEAVGAPLTDYVPEYTRTRTNVLMVYYLGSLKKTGAPIVIKNPTSGLEINTAKLTLSKVDGEISFMNAPPGLQAQGPTTILYVNLEGAD